MDIENKNQSDEVQELPDSWWYKVYLAVIVVTVLVISLLGLFSRYFSG